MAAALVAGILQNFVFLAVAFFLVVRGVYKAHMSRADALLLSLLCGLLYCHGHFSIDRYRLRISEFDRQASALVGPLLVEGWVSSYPQQAYGQTRFEFVTVIGGVTHRLLVRAPDFLIGYGDSLRMRVRPRDSRGLRPGYLLSRGVSGSVGALGGSVTRLPGHGGSIAKRSVMWPIHDRVRRETVKGLGAGAGLPLALLLGERGLLTRNVREAFAILGVSHLLALSGLHLGFVALVLMLVTRQLHRWRGRIVLASLALYVAVVGFILSLYRALIMATLLIAAKGVHRPPRLSQALVIAFVVMLLLYPFALFSVAFQLSFLATLAVILIVGKLGAAAEGGYWMRVWHGFRSTVQISVAVQIVLLPVLLTYFGGISLVAPLATAVLVVPVIVLLVSSGIGVAVSMISVDAGRVFYELIEPAAATFDRFILLSADIVPDHAVIPVPSLFLYYLGLSLIWFSRTRVIIKLFGILLVASAWLPVFSNLDF